MTPNEVIAEVRQLVQDTRAAYRYSDDLLLGFVNQIIKRMVMYRPDLFSYIGEITPTVGSALQTLPAGSVRLVEVFNIKNGAAVVEADRRTMDRTVPGWMSEAAAAPVNFMRHPRNPNSYFLHPRPITGTVLIAEYVKVPDAYEGNDTIELPEAYFPALVDGTVFLTESIDAEHINSGRAKLFYESFIQGMSVSLESRNMTDKDGAAVKEVK